MSMSLYKHYFTYFTFILLISNSYPSVNNIYKVDEIKRADDYYDRTHRQTFYHQGLHYVFFIDDNSDLVYSRYDEKSFISKDIIVGNVWSFADFSLVQEGNYVYLAYAIPEGMNFSVYFLLGEIKPDGIEWLTPIQLDIGDRPFIDLHNGKPVIVYSNGKEACFKWAQSSDKLGNNWTTSNTLLSWGMIDKDYFPAVYSLGENGLMFIYWHGGTDRVYAIRYYEGKYSDPVLLYNCFDYLMEYQYFYYCWDVIVDRDNEVYFLNPAGEVLKWSADDDEWEVDKQLMSETKEIALGLSYENKSDELYFFSLIKENGILGYYIRNSTGWSEFTRLSNITDYKISGNTNEYIMDGKTSIRWFGSDDDLMVINFGIINIKEVKPDETVGGNSQKILKTTPNLVLFTFILLLAGLTFVLKKTFLRLE